MRHSRLHRVLGVGVGRGQGWECEVLRVVPGHTGGKVRVSSDSLTRLSHRCPGRERRLRVHGLLRTHLGSGRRRSQHAARREHHARSVFLGRRNVPLSDRDGTRRVPRIALLVDPATLTRSAVPTGGCETGSRRGLQVGQVIESGRLHSGWCLRAARCERKLKRRKQRMSFLARGSRRGRRSVAEVSVGALMTFQALAILGAPSALAISSCTFSGGALSIVLSRGESIVFSQNASGVVLVNGANTTAAPCSTTRATVTNTTAISVTGLTGERGRHHPDGLGWSRHHHRLVGHDQLADRPGIRQR